jgi:GT2 family glycosyltransferase
MTAHSVPIAMPFACSNIRADVQGKLVVSIISVNYNNARLLAECVRHSCAALEGIEYEMVLVDNCSTDDSYQFLQAHFSDRLNVRVVRSERNAGFGYGCNFGAKLAHAPVLWFLNSDAWIIDISGLPETLDYLRRSDTGLIGTAAYLPDGSPCPQAGGELSFTYFLLSSLRLGKLFRALPTPLGSLVKSTRNLAPITIRRYLESFDHGRQSSIYATQSAGGASFLIAGTTYEALHGFDERFFLYDEDGDLCARAIGADYKIYIQPRINVKMFASATTSKLPSLELKAIKRRSRVLLIKKHFTGFKKNILLIATALTWRLL